jgi:hypothetical protein
LSNKNFHLCDDRDLCLNRFFGAGRAAVCHAFAPRLDRVEIAVSFDLPNRVPCGSHPMLDPEYGSFDVRIRHRDVELSRINIRHREPFYEELLEPLAARGRFDLVEVIRRKLGES